MINNEKGVTLIELLATLVIFGIFSVIIWGFLFQTSKINHVEMTKQSLQQEANLIVTTFNEVHRKSGIYEIHISNDLTDNSIEIITSNGENYIFNKPDVHYALKPIFTTLQIKPQDDNFELDLTLTSIENAHITTSIKTTFTRLK